MVTTKDIAKKLNLAVSTIGRALSDHPRISRATKERVRLTAEELGYVASVPARIMRGGTSHLIGLLVPDIRSAFYSLIAQTLSKCFEADGFHLALSITDDNRETELQQLRELMSVRVAGVIVVPSANPRRETLAFLRTIPHVQILRQHQSMGNWFGLDDERCIRTAIEYLIQLGHRRIGFIGDEIYSTGRARLMGFRIAHRESKIPIDDDLIVLGPPNSEFAAQAVGRLLEQQDPPTAIITSSVLGTLGAAEKLTELQIDVPSKLSFLGFGDGIWERWWGPGLTTIRLPTEELATSCGLYFLHTLKSKQPTDPSHSVICSTNLVVRGSTAAPHAPAAGRQKR